MYSDDPPINTVKTEASHRRNSKFWNSSKHKKSQLKDALKQSYACSFLSPLHPPVLTGLTEGT